jgi:hypothetical protein
MENAMRLQPAELILHNGKIATQDDRRSIAEAAAIRDGKFVAVGSEREVMLYRGENSAMVNLNRRTAIPGLNDSHLHLIRGGLNYNLELRWDGVPSLADGLRMLREQAQRTPPGQWVRVVGGWSEFQFAERRMPTLEELNRAAPVTPVFVLHLYDRALLNRAALRAVGYTKNSPGLLAESVSRRGESKRYEEVAHRHNVCSVRRQFPGSVVTAYRNSNCVCGSAVIGFCGCSTVRHNPCLCQAGRLRYFRRKSAGNVRWRHFEARRLHGDTDS